MGQKFFGKYMLDADKIVIDTSGKTPPKFFWSVEPDTDEIVNGIFKFTGSRLTLFFGLLFIIESVLVNLILPIPDSTKPPLNILFLGFLGFSVFHPNLFYVYKNEKFWNWVQDTVFKLDNILVPTFITEKKFLHLGGKSKLKEILIQTDQDLSSEWEVNGDYKKYLYEIEIKRKKHLDDSSPDVFMIFKFTKKPQDGYLKLWWR